MEIEQEAYIVKLTYQKEDGFWVQSYEEVFLIPKRKRVKGASHELAKQAALKKYGEHTVVHTITYV